MPYSLREALAAFRRAPALTGLSAIPEPANLLALGCLVGFGALIRRRSQRR